MERSADVSDLSARAATLSPERQRILERWKRGRGAAGGGIPRQPDGAERVLSFAQERLWLLDQLLGGGSTYNTVPSAVWLRGPLDVPALESGLTEVVRRHETLRTTFQRAGDGRPRPVIGPAGPRPGARARRAARPPPPGP